MLIIVAAREGRRSSEAEISPVARSRLAPIKFNDGGREVGRKNGGHADRFIHSRGQWVNYVSPGSVTARVRSFPGHPSGIAPLFVPQRLASGW